MSTYLLPITGLLTSTDLDLAIGSVRLLGPDRAKACLRGAGYATLLPEALRGDFDELEGEVASCVSAWVQAEDRDAAVELVETALDLIRVFLYTRSLGAMRSFGITDGVLGGAVRYVELDAGGIGRFRVGHFTGVYLTDESVQAYSKSLFAALVGSAVGVHDAEPNQAKALTSIRLASRALLTSDAATQIVLMMTAAEVLLFGPRERSASYRLAQRSAFLLCGRPDGERCGRDRDSCLILKTDLENRGAVKKLRKVREMGAVDPQWRCSEWIKVLDWYDMRSQVVHEGTAVDRDEASRVTYWLINRLLPAALSWYSENQEAPHAAIESALRGLPQPPRWQLDYARRHELLAADGAFDELSQRGASWTR